MLQRRPCWLDCSPREDGHKGVRQVGWAPINPPARGAAAADPLAAQRVTRPSDRAAGLEIACSVQQRVSGAAHLRG